MKFSLKMVANRTIPGAVSSLVGLTFFFNSVSPLFAAGTVFTISSPTNGRVTISWIGRGMLETASQLGGPWTTITNATNPYTVSITNAHFFRLNQTVDAMTLHKKVLCGYQGWFRCSGDGSSNMKWYHWTTNSSTTITATNLAFDMWPEMSEYTNKYRVPGLTNSDGTLAYLYSPQDQQTVDVHFNWMRDYGIDGVAVQRFVSDIPGRPWMTNVVNYVRAAANRTGRVFVLEYDMSGAGTDTLFNMMTNDWINLAGAQKLTQDPRYLYQDGKPVLMIFGFYSDRFTNSAGLTLLPQQIIDWFKTNAIKSFFLVGSGDHNWRTDKTIGWSNVVRSLDGYIPWNAGNTMTVGGTKYANTNSWTADLAEANRIGMLYIPELYPGFSWDNLKGLPPGTSKIDRLGGNFLWKQFYDVANLGVDMAFVGMFDEVNEGTAIYKVSNIPPTEAYLVTYDGLPTDWYLRLTAEGSKVISGERPNTLTIPISP